jgi:hypothetical protein
MLPASLPRALGALLGAVVLHGLALAGPNSLFLLPTPAVLPAGTSAASLKHNNTETADTFVQYTEWSPANGGWYELSYATRARQWRGGMKLYTLGNTAALGVRDIGGGKPDGYWIQTTPTDMMPGLVLGGVSSKQGAMLGVMWPVGNAVLFAEGTSGWGGDGGSDYAADAHGALSVAYPLTQEMECKAGWVREEAGDTQWMIEIGSVSVLTARLRKPSRRW